MVSAPSGLTSRVVTWLRNSKLPFGRRARVLALWLKTGAVPRADIRFGPYTVAFDLTEEFQAMMAIGAYEPETPSLYERVLRPGDIYVDVGAHIGYTAALAAEQIGKTGKMLLFEPDPRLYSRLLKSITAEVADGALDVDARDCACSDSDGTITLWMNPILGQSQTGRDIPVDHPMCEVATVRLDRVLAERGIDRVRLLKIDVEGHELSVLRGLDKSLAQHAFDYVLIEKNDYVLPIGYSATHLHSMFAHHGYTGVNMEYRRLTQATLNANMVENFLYATSEEMLRAALPGGLTLEAPQELADIEIFFSDLYDPNALRVKGNRFVYEATQGRLAEAIEGGETLLAENPEMNWLRGHLAFWHRITGNVGRARELLLVMRDVDPGDPAVPKLLDEIGWE